MSKREWTDAERKNVLAEAYYEETWRTLSELDTLAAFVLDARAEAATLREYLAKPNKALDEVARDNDRLRAEVERLTVERNAAQSVLADVTATLSGEFNTRISAARLDGAIEALEDCIDTGPYQPAAPTLKEIQSRIAELKAERSKL